MASFATNYSERVLPCGATLVFYPLGGDSGLLEFYFPDSLHGALVSCDVAEQVLASARLLATIPDPKVVFAEIVPVWEY